MTGCTPEVWPPARWPLEGCVSGTPGGNEENYGQRNRALETCATQLNAPCMYRTDGHSTVSKAGSKLGVLNALSANT